MAAMTPSPRIGRGGGERSEPGVRAVHVCSAAARVGPGAASRSSSAASKQRRRARGSGFRQIFFLLLSRRSATARVGSGTEVPAKGGYAATKSPPGTGRNPNAAALISKPLSKSGRVPSGPRSRLDGLRPRSLKTRLGKGSACADWTAPTLLLSRSLSVPLCLLFPSPRPFLLVRSLRPLRLCG